MSMSSLASMESSFGGFPYGSESICTFMFSCYYNDEIAHPWTSGGVLKFTNKEEECCGHFSSRGLGRDCIYVGHLQNLIGSLM